MNNVVSRYASLVKFSHTVFAMPFALLSYVYALVSTAVPFDWLLLVKILLCMVFARNAAMGFNRWADRDIDAKNPRTAGREIPAGKITPACGAGVRHRELCGVRRRGGLDKLPRPLAVARGARRAAGLQSDQAFHRVVACGAGPGARHRTRGGLYCCDGSVALFPVLLAVAVLTWTAGFDILYSLQDASFDRSNGLHSVPARFSAVHSTLISILLHVFAVAAVAVLGALYRLGVWYWVGFGLFTAVLVVQHVLYRPSRIDRIGASFGLVNGLASVSYAPCRLSPC